MPTHCVAFRCNNKGVKRSDKKVHFFTFPSDENTRLKWIVALKREHYTWKSSHRLCSDHFTNEDYERNPLFMAAYGYAQAVPRLKKEAVPSVFEFIATSSINGQIPVLAAYNKCRKLEATKYKNAKCSNYKAMNWAPEIKVEFTPTDIKSEPDFITTGDKDECMHQAHESTTSTVPEGCKSMNLAPEIKLEVTPANIKSEPDSIASCDNYEPQNQLAMNWAPEIKVEFTPTDIKSEPDFITTEDNYEPNPGDVIGVGVFKIEVKAEADDIPVNDSASDVTDESAVPIGEFTSNDAGHTHKIEVIETKDKQDVSSNVSKKKIPTRKRKTKANTPTNKGRAKITTNDRNTEAKIPTKKRKTMRQVYIGWKHLGCKIPFIMGGGSKSIVVPGDYTYDQLLQAVRDEYFPNGQNFATQHRLKDLETHLATFSGCDLTPQGCLFTVEEFYNWHDVHATIYLYTELKEDQEVSSPVPVEIMVDREQSGSSSTESENEKKILAHIKKTKAKILTKKRNTKAKINTKATRQILIGWKHSGHTMPFNTGGSQSVVVPKEFTYEQLLQSACDLYFPNGVNSDRQLRLKDLDTHLANFIGLDLVPDKGRSFTVDEFYIWNGYTTWICLHTELKHVDPDSSPVPVEMVSVKTERSGGSSTESATEDTSQDWSPELSDGLTWDIIESNTCLRSCPINKPSTVESKKARTLQNDKICRYIHIGWKHYIDGHFQKIKKSLQKIKVKKNLSYEQLLETITSNYFPNGKCSTIPLPLSKLYSGLVNFAGTDICKLVQHKSSNFTVEDYFCHQYHEARIYLQTKEFVMPDIISEHSYAQYESDDDMEELNVLDGDIVMLANGKSQPINPMQKSKKRKIYLEWKHFYKKQFHKVGLECGIKVINILSHLNYKQILDTITPIFFPNGENAQMQLKLNQMDIYLSNNEGTDICKLLPHGCSSFTVEDFYWHQKKSPLRIYLHTKRKKQVILYPGLLKILQG